MNTRACGVDVQQSRGCPFVVLEPGRRSHRCVATGWLEGASPADLRTGLSRVLREHAVTAVGIDAPRQPLPGLRHWKVTGGAWRESPRGLTGRHCEVVISSCRLANPQWTPLAEDAPPWMQNGFALFASAAEQVGDRVHEVFPSAAYRLLNGDSSLRFELAAGDFARGPKDLLDAAMAAATVLEFEAGRGAEVGGGDGLGTIILPRPIPNLPPGVSTWPTP